ncbi:MAG: SDR family NAD(P)-dependent oxidoreductase [Succinivibrio sp.]
MKKIVIVGATSRIAHMCARLWVQEDCDEIVLVGRNTEKLNTVAVDLKTRSEKLSCNIKLVNFFNTEDIKNCVDSICSNRVPDVVLIAQGSSLPTNDRLREDIFKEEESIRLNFISVALFLENFTKHLESVGVGSIAVIGSVAGDRGRASNYIYGSSKAAIETYVSGLSHYLALKKTNIHITLVKPGPTQSPLTADLPLKKLANPENVAQEIITAVRKNRRKVYSPFKWTFIMAVVRIIPNFIFNKINF